jgi:hypothetical protein
MPLMMWGNAGAKTGKYNLEARYSNFGKYTQVNVIQLLTNTLNYYVSISDRGNARFSKTAAEACAKFVRKQIRANAYKSMVPALTKKWAKTKSRLKLAHQTGMATEHLVRNITAFRTNIKDHAFKETRHTGYVVGVNQMADFTRDADKVPKMPKRKSYRPDYYKAKVLNKKKNKVKEVQIWRLGSDFLNAKLYWLEHGFTGKGHKGVSFRVPPRPIFTKAVEDFIRKFKGGEDFVGQLKMGSRGTLEFKFKAHR